MGFGFNIGEENDFGAQQSQEERALAFERQVLRDEQLRRLKAGTKRTFKGFDKGGEKVGRGFAKFGKLVARPPQRVFSQEQEALHSQFGGGDHFWGLGDESDTRVRINNDLNPSRSNPYDETAGMFGFGGNGERSGLF